MNSTVPSMANHNISVSRPMAVMRRYKSATARNDDA